jgi:DNA-binding transcriptional LysR family regulator
MNWDDHRYFLAIARARSLTAAGRALGVSQPTVSRRLDAMEARLKVRLFDRTKRGYQLTTAGMEIYETVEQVEQDLNSIDRKVFGQDLQVTGSLCFTCTEVLLNGYLAPHVWRFLELHPGIDLSVICTDSQLSLSRREADLAIRFTGRPPDTLLGRRLVKVAFGVYVSRAGGGDQLDLDRPETWDWIGWQDETHNRMLIHEAFSEARLRHRVDSVATMQSMARSGLGVAVLPCYIADCDNGLRRVLPAFFSNRIPDLWILTHPDVRRVARVRLFAEFIAEAIRADLELFEGRRPM